MNHVLVVQEKNTKNVAENYEKINIDSKTRTTKNGNSDFFDSKISKILFCGTFKEPRSAVFVTKPLFLPIFKNLFFLLLKISSPVID